MMRPLFLHDCDEAISNGCDNPFCTAPHGSELFLTSLCHPRTGVRVEMITDCEDLPCSAVLGVRCWRCYAPVALLALTAPLALTPACRHGRALDVLYGEGTLTVRCRRCQAVHGTVAVAAYLPESYD